MDFLFDNGYDTVSFDHEDLYFRRLDNSCSRSSFFCGNCYLDEFLVEDALKSQTYNVSTTKLAYWYENVLGYFPLVNDGIVTDMLEEDDRKEGYHHRKYPALKITRLATHHNYKKMSIGSAILAEIYITAFGISAHSGCRFITVDSKYESTEFYIKNGFKQAVSRPSHETIPMYLDFYKLSKMHEFI